MDVESVIVEPDPERVVEGLRDTGYEFPTAIADIVDNSLAAEASVVDLRISMDVRGAVIVSIADNGYGMDRGGLVNAMRYGSERRSDPESLGKFGLGLKTASTAFCRRLSLVSRPANATSALMATWDLEHIAKHGWELLFAAPTVGALSHLDSVAKNHSGTVVVWEKVDRLMKDYKMPGGAAASKAFNRLMDHLKHHLGMVYQRFLDPEDPRAPTVAMTLNGEPVMAWDPFCVMESRLVASEDVTVDLGNGKKTKFSVRAYILPRKEEFSTPEAHEVSRLGNDTQGIYIYREERLIHSADWLGMFQKEPHGSLLRVEFSFNHNLDEDFNVDIKKSQIILSEDLWEWLRDQFLTAPRREADKSYRRGQNKVVAGKAQDAHDMSNKAIGAKADGLDSSRITIMDAETGEAEIENRQGTTRLRLKVGHALKPNQYHVQPVPTLDDGILWSPALIDGHQAVQINTGHPYYHKVYVPNMNSSVTVQGMDSLLWALCSAEYGTLSNQTKQHFEDMRYAVSRILRRLVDDLPEPRVDDDSAES